MGGVIFTALSLFHFLETVKHPEKWSLLRNSSGNVNASGAVSCQYPQTY